MISITIPDSVTSIGYDAFLECSSLQEIIVAEGNPVYHSDGNCLIETASKTLILGCKTSVIPDDSSVTSIGDYAFQECSGLTSIVIPDSVTSIGYSAFRGCSGLTSITIPDSVTSIGLYAFSGCSGLTDVYYQGDLSGWLGLEFDSYFEAPMYYADNLYINGELLQGDIVIPDGTKKIGNYAFCNCSGLTSVTIPDSVRSIGDYAFSGCSGMISITIPDSVISIGDHAFSGCSGLTSITIPDGVTSIGRYAFSGCSGLTSVTIPDGVTSIGEGAFYYCSGLTSITILDSVTSIDYYAFSGCSGLTDVYYQGDLSGWLGIEFVGPWANPMNYAENLYINGELVQGELVIPDSVTSIGDYAFYYCSGLTSVVIPDSVTSIGYNAFDGCSGLTSVTIPDSVTSIGDWAFERCSGLTTINFQGTKAQWQAIGKDSNWDRYTGEYAVICTDGTISKADA